MTKQTKKNMTRTERKAYKAAQRKGRESFYVFVTRETPKNPGDHILYTKLVSREKAHEMVNGKMDPYTGTRKLVLKHKYVQQTKITKTPEDR